MEPALSSTSLGYCGMLRGTVMRPVFKANTIHYSYRWRQVVRANVDDTRWIEKGKRGGLASRVVLACVVGMMSMGIGSGKAMGAVEMAVAVGPKTGRVALPTPRTGGLDAADAIEALLEVSKFLSTKEKGMSRHWNAYMHAMPNIDPNKGPSKKEVDEIKKEAMYKIKLGNVEEGENLLRAEYEKWKVKGGEVEYNLEMAIVEVLIAQGRYGEAGNFNCIKGRPASKDPRIPLYKAIIYTALMDKNSTGEQVESAKRLWDEFKESVGVDSERPT